MRLAAARKLKGLGQAEAGAQIGVSRTTLSGWENGEPIDEAWIAPIVRTYGGSKSWVRYGEGVAPVGYLENGADYPGEAPAKYPKTPAQPPVGGAEKPPVKRRRKGSR